MLLQLFDVERAAAVAVDRRVVEKSAEMAADNVNLIRLNVLLKLWRLSI